MKVKERLENSSRLNESKQLNATCDSGSLGYNECGWDNWWHLNGVFGLEGSNVFMLVSWFWWFYCSRTIHYFVGNTPYRTHTGVIEHDDCMLQMVQRK